MPSYHIQNHSLYYSSSICPFRFIQIPVLVVRNVICVALSPSPSPSLLVTKVALALASRTEDNWTLDSAFAKFNSTQAISYIPLNLIRVSLWYSRVICLTAPLFISSPCSPCFSLFLPLSLSLFLSPLIPPASVSGISLLNRNQVKRILAATMCLPASLEILSPSLSQCL